MSRMSQLLTSGKFVVTAEINPPKGVDIQDTLTRANPCVVVSFTPNPPKDTDGRREDSGRVGEGAIGEMAGLHWGRLEVGGRSSVAA